MNITSIKFIHAHIQTHLNQYEIFKLNAGYLSKTQKTQIIAQSVVYHNITANLNIKSALGITIGIIKNATNHTLKPIVFHKAILFINLESNIFIIIIVIK